MPIQDMAKEPTPRMGEQLRGASARTGGEKPLKPDTEVSDGIGGAKSNLSVASNDQINVIMKEEQLDFAYDNMEKGSNKSFKADDD